MAYVNPALCSLQSTICIEVWKNKTAVLPSHLLDISGTAAHVNGLPGVYTLTSHVLRLSRQKPPPAGSSTGVYHGSDEFPAAELHKLSICCHLFSCYQDNEQDTADW